MLNGYYTEIDGAIVTTTLDGNGYSAQFSSAGQSGNIDGLGYSIYDDLYLVICFYHVSQDATYLAGLDLVFYDTATGEYEYRFGTNPNTGADKYIIGVQIGNWYTIVLPISKDWYTKYTAYPAIDYFQLGSIGDSVIYVDWWGLFRLSAFADDYCADCRCGMVNNVDSGVRDIDSDDCYLKTTNSDLEIGVYEDYDVDSNNAKLTIYGTLGEGMRLKITIAWEISSTPQTDKVLYATELPYAFDLDIECPSIDKVTNIKIENILVP